MPSSLLQSQVATLEPLEEDERGVVLDLTRSPEELAARAISLLGLPAAASAHAPSPHWSAHPSGCYSSQSGAVTDAVTRPR